ncbi:MAG: hypothetical protein M5R42_08030 [Rhodocyclaceae bacterium]|nr:hypothetical protein [Rhodocyclaceae bacterium]
MYFKSLSAGVPIKVDIGDGKVMEAYRRGEQSFYARTGQLNMACASCHVPGSIMGHKLRGETPTTPFGDTAHFPTYRTPVGALSRSRSASPPPQPDAHPRSSAGRSGLHGPGSVHDRAVQRLSRFGSLGALAGDYIWSNAE